MTIEVEALFAQEHHPGGDVQQRLLVHQVQVVVHRTGVLGPHRRAGAQQQRHQRVVGDVLPRVHQAHHRACPGHRGQHAADRGAVGGGELVHRGVGRLRAAARGQVAAGAEALGGGSAHAGSTRSASLSCWVIALSRGTPATALYQTACRQPVARRSITIGPAAVISKYGPIRPDGHVGVLGGDLRQRACSPGRRARTAWSSSRLRPAARQLPGGRALDDQLGLAGQQLAEVGSGSADDVEQRVDGQVGVQVLLRA